MSRALEQRGAKVAHILADGSLEHQSHTMTRLIDMVGLGDADGYDMFTGNSLTDTAALVEKACRLRESKIAYIKP